MYKWTTCLFWWKDGTLCRNIFMFSVEKSWDKYVFLWRKNRQIAGMGLSGKKWQISGMGHKPFLLFCLWRKKANIRYSPVRKNDKHHVWATSPFRYFACGERMTNISVRKKWQIWGMGKKPFLCRPASTAVMASDANHYLQTLFPL